MKKITVALMLLAFIAHSCKKETDKEATAPNPAEVLVDLEGETIKMSDKANKCSMYSFGGVAGSYFGVHSNYEINGKVDLEITFGTGLSANSTITDSEFVTLVSPGRKKFGSLGSFDTNPELKSGRVEIAYIDKDSKRWCSTQITEKVTSSGTEKKVKVNQEHSSFTIDELENYASVENVPGYKIKGSFNCFVYEVNGNAKKKMTGSFSGIIYRGE